jgi:hypothetical protein
MKRVHMNFAVDVLAFAAFLLLLSTGVLLRYSLPPGSGELTGRGTGHGAAQQLVSLLWGWTRHEWGSIHFWIAAVLLMVLAAHLFLHWKWVVSVVRGTRSDASGWRFGVGLASLCALVLFAAAPLLAPIESATRQQIVQERSPTAIETDIVQTPGLDAADLNELRGSATLSEIARERGITVEYLRGKLGLPEGVSPDAHIGPILREHGLRMTDLRALIAGVKDRHDAEASAAENITK